MKGGIFAVKENKNECIEEVGMEEVIVRKDKRAYLTLSELFEEDEIDVNALLQMLEKE